jgi:hypothetical protein
MLRTYKAILHGDHVEWLDKPPEQTQPVPAHITLLEEAALEPARERGRVMVEALAAPPARSADTPCSGSPSGVGGFAQ